MQRSAIIVIMAASIVRTAVVAATPPIASDLERAVHGKGATYVASKMTETEFDYVIAESAKGRPEWLRFAVDLLPGTDGARAEAIEGALSAALQTAPTDVLRLIQATPSRLQVNRICEDRTIEPKDPEVRNYTIQSTKAVRKVAASSLRQLRDACLVSLRKAAAA